MNANTLRYSRGFAAAATMVVAANLTTVAPAVADYNIGALACQPPYLDQAQNLRWHEHYVINPVDSQTTWIVCPIAYDHIKLPDTFQIGAFGNSTIPGTNALCYANVIDLRNQHIPEGGFLNNPGQNMIYSNIMSTQNPSNTLWSTWHVVSQAAVNARMMNPPSTPVNPSGAKGPAFWTITINCQLKPGQALNMVSLWPTRP